MEEQKKTYINVELDDKETALLNQAKDKTGIKNTTDLIRYLITRCAKGE